MIPPRMLAALLILALATSAPTQDFYAHYTKIDSGLPFEKVSRTGESADVVVVIGKLSGKLVFHRQASYLPYWQTAAGRWSVDEIVPRTGDGKGKMPDRVNTYSRVAIVESAPDEIVVHWRYLPRFGGDNPHTGVDATGFVDEYYTVTPDGGVVRTIRQGSARVARWRDPRQQTTQELRLTESGIVQERRTEPSSSGARAPVAGRPVLEPVGSPVRSWTFDEGTGVLTGESATSVKSEVTGHETAWKRGVSGTALAFDGYTTAVRMPAAQAPRIGCALTLEGWIAIAAYPWNWAPVVQQGDDDGYFLGIDGHGLAGFKVKVGDRWEELASEQHLDRYRWYHLAGTYDGATGQLTLYVDGKPSATRSVVGAGVATTGDDVAIGQGRSRRPVDPVRANTFRDVYSFDGLIDEVRIHDRALTPELIARSHEMFRPDGRPDLEVRALPQTRLRGSFGASYTHLRFYEAWDNLWRFGGHPDVVVEFDTSPSAFVFWRGAGYIPMLVNENAQWYSNEFNETWGRSGGQGCQEPMSDKEAFTNHARILENTAARVVVHWRYPLVDVWHVIANFDADTGWGDWADWYYTIYPDGVAVKRMRLWTDGPRNHEWQESMAILGPGQHPESVLEKSPALILADLEGHTDEYDWSDGPPRSIDYRDRKIHVVNYRAELDPFTIGDFTGGDVYGGEVTEYSVFPSWNHWPVAQMPSDGRYASFPDRTAHSSLTHVRLPTHREEFGARPFQEKILVEGLTDRGAAELVPLARSWLHPPELRVVADCRAGGYDVAQGAFVLVPTATGFSFRIEASVSRPMVNPCFEILDWSSNDAAVLRVDGRRVEPGPGFRQGIVRDGIGRQKMVIWLARQAQEPVEIAIAGARPVASTPTPRRLGWVEAPRLLDGTPSIAMAATEALDPSGVEYYFQCSAGDGHDSGWIDSPRYTDTGLSPGSEYRYRVKARNRYLAETEWSETGAVDTPPAPPPVVLTFDAEGAITDAAGVLRGDPVGPVERTNGRAGKALRLGGRSHVVFRDTGGLASRRDFTWCAWIRTEADGTVVGRTGRGDSWQPGGKVLFIRRGRLSFDAGWVGAVTARGRVSDGEWHHVAVAVRGGTDVALFVDGKRVGGGELEVAEHAEAGLPWKIGYCNEDFPAQPGLNGEIDDVRWYSYALNLVGVAELFESF